MITQIFFIDRDIIINILKINKCQSTLNKILFLNQQEFIY